MLYTEKIKLASQIMVEAHTGQVDKGGYPYTMHPMHLAEQMAFEDEIIVALLHDVAEDHPEYWSLIKSNFSESIVDALDILNRHSSQNKGLTYFEYIKNVAKNNLASKVKLVDLAHNLDTTRTNTNNCKGTRSKRYEQAYNYILDNIGIELELEEIDINDTHIKNHNKIIHKAYKMLIDTPKYRGEVYVALKSNLSGSKASIVDCYGKLGTKSKRFPVRSCNNFGYMSAMVKRRLTNANEPLIKEHFMVFKSVDYNRDIKIGISMDYETGSIKSIRLYECINTLERNKQRK